MDNIGYIFSGVRHEIGNPINTAKMVLSVLRQKLEQSSQETIRDYIGRALREIGRVEYHLKTLKNFNLYETLEPGNVNMASFMDSFLSLVIPDLEKKGMAITMKFQSGAEWAYADPRALQQALLNLVTNAADALEGRQGPTIAITVSKREKSVLIQIQDNGCGMSEEEQKTLFKPFVTSKKKGTGLGLVLVKKMLTKMNGSIEISSRLNVGTTVDIMIPEGTNDACEQENTPDH
jgi:C4-dicarboxylate-specific signal transduction histidine kinase